jgi:hypothetical protein
VSVLIVVVGSLLVVMGVFGNALILLTLSTQRSLRSLHHMYVGNLAVSDLVIVSYVLPYWLADIATGKQVVSKLHCRLNAFILFLCLYSSIYSLVLIGFNRYLRVCRPWLYQRLFTRRATWLCCACTWLMSAAECALPLSQVHPGTRFEYGPYSHLCAYDAHVPGEVNIFAIISALNFMVPTLLVGFFSAAIVKAWQATRTRVESWASGNNESTVTTRTQANPTNPTQQPASGSAAPTTTQLSGATRRVPYGRISMPDMGLMRSLFLVFILLVLLYIPIATALIMLESSYSVPSEVMGLLVLLCFLNQAINWIIYGALNLAFRNGYKRLYFSVATCCRGCVDFLRTSDE